MYGKPRARELTCHDTSDITTSLLFIACWIYDSGDLNKEAQSRAMQDSGILQLRDPYKCYINVIEYLEYVKDV